MSKFLKFIVHFAVICTIVCVLGLALPPFFGVRTVIMDSTDKATNLPLGSVTYAIPVRTEEVTAGSPILVQEDGKTYKYNLVSVNRENNTGTVIDTTTSAQESITVSVKNWVPKIVIMIPFVGYLLVATESVEGLIVLGLVILFLIILYVIAELWRKDPEDDEYEDLQGDTRHVKSSRELKAEEKARAKRMKQEDKELLQNAKEKKKKVVAIGTTSLRALESASQTGQLASGNNETSLFITPGYRFRTVDHLVTNFHLPKSTLLMLVSAFAGYERIRKAYAHAVRKRYRFFSYGDAMLLKCRKDSSI